LVGLPQQAQNKFLIANSKSVVSVVYDTADAQTVAVTANLFADDVERITGTRPAVLTSMPLKAGNVILVGSVGGSRYVKRLVADKKSDLSRLSGSWECYAWRFLKRNDGQSGNVMVIAGSDRRGTAYGIFELSRTLGVSPWYWWADVTPEKRELLSIPALDVTSTEPSVKYRGIFLNDEGWGLNPWASQTFEPEVGDIGPKTYARIFELLLRLKANLIWPAMHPCTSAFFSNPENPRTADTYGIVVGSSHAEPMLRNNVDEWKKNERGAFNFFTNRENVLNYWDQRVAESAGNDCVYTLGMRGIHDSGMVGASSVEEQVAALETVIGEQRQMIKHHVNSDETAVPQVFTAYKEVLDVYDAGLELPDDVTLVWPDDNYGYIKRLSNEREQQRVGGSGVYYHLSYWGRPHDYLWLSSTHPALIREEMMKAAGLKVKNLWVANVGDIKPLEYNITLFLDMAYDNSRFARPLSEQQHLVNWFCDIFGSEIGAHAADLLWQYYDLNFERRTEFMGWSQTEPTRKTHSTEYNHFQAGDEAQRRIDAFNRLAADARKLRKQVPGPLDDAFYQLVYYPVVNSGLMNKKFLYSEKATKYAEQGRLVANDLAEMGKAAYDSILLETAYYNEAMANGKWNHMMCYAPRSLPVFNSLPMPQWQFDGTGWALAVEGDEEIRRYSDLFGPQQLPYFYRAENRTSFIDLFLKDNRTVKWTVTPSHPCIKTSLTSGVLTGDRMQKQKRIRVWIDWNALDVKGLFNGKLTFTADDGKKVTVTVKAENLMPEVKTDAPVFMEENGYLSIYAGNYTRKTDGVFPLEEYSGLGYSGCSVGTLCSGAQRDSSDIESSVLEYDFYTPRGGNIKVNVWCIPTHPVNSDEGLRLYVSVDDATPQKASIQSYGRSEKWKQNVLRNNTLVTIPQRIASKGLHTLKIVLPDPGVIIDRIEIDRGGLPDVYSVLPESYQIPAGN
jgi:hypothetical protein